MVTNWKNWCRLCAKCKVEHIGTNQENFRDTVEKYFSIKVNRS